LSVYGQNTKKACTYQKTPERGKKKEKTSTLQGRALRQALGEE